MLRAGLLKAQEAVEAVVEAVAPAEEEAPAPLVEAFIEAIYFSYNTTQRAPLGTVTTTPELIVIGPVLIAFLPLDIV